MLLVSRLAHTANRCRLVYERKDAADLATELSRKTVPDSRDPVHRV
jgi:hypothetical protein